MLDFVANLAVTIIEYIFWAILILGGIGVIVVDDQEERMMMDNHSKRWEKYKEKKRLEGEKK